MRPPARTRRRPSAGSSSTRRRSQSAFKKAGMSGDGRERAQLSRRSMLAQAEQCIYRRRQGRHHHRSLDTGTSIAIQKKFTAVGGKTIDYDRQIIGGTGSVYISFDNPGVGRQQALGVLAGMKKNGTYNANGTVAQLWGGPTDANAFAFKSGNDAVLNPLFKAKKIKRGPAKFVPRVARRARPRRSSSRCSSRRTTTSRASSPRTTTSPVPSSRR